MWVLSAFYIGSGDQTQSSSFTFGTILTAPPPRPLHPCFQPQGRWSWVVPACLGAHGVSELMQLPPGMSQLFVRSVLPGSPCSNCFPRERELSTLAGSCLDHCLCRVFLRTLGGRAELQLGPRTEPSPAPKLQSVSLIFIYFFA